MGLISELLEEERNEQQVHAVVERNGGRPRRSRRTKRTVLNERRGREVESISINLD